eukprot:5747785-Pyramimonas_sp.AAC.1
MDNKTKQGTRKTNMMLCRILLWDGNAGKVTPGSRTRTNRSRDAPRPWLGEELQASCALTALANGCRKDDLRPPLRGLGPAATQA